MTAPVLHWPAFRSAPTGTEAAACGKLVDPAAITVDGEAVTCKSCARDDAVREIRGRAQAIRDRVLSARKI